MKALCIFVSYLVLSGCAHMAPTVLSFSSEFKLSLPNDFIAGATIFSVDELSVKSLSGDLISGGIISVDTEGLPSDFDMTNYPRYILKIERPDPRYLDAFNDSSDEIDYTYSLSSLEIDETPILNIYSLCKNISCLAYVVKTDFKEHIFSVHSRGLLRDDLIKLIKGDLNAKYE